MSVRYYGACDLCGRETLLEAHDITPRRMALICDACLDLLMTRPVER